MDNIVVRRPHTLGVGAVNGVVGFQAEDRDLIGAWEVVRMRENGSETNQTMQLVVESGQWTTDNGQ